MSPDLTHCLSVCLCVCMCGAELTHVKPMFGLSLADHLQHTDRQISAVIEQSVVALCSPEYDALREEVSNSMNTHIHSDPHRGVRNQTHSDVTCDFHESAYCKL